MGRIFLGIWAATFSASGMAAAAPAADLPDWSGVWNPADRNIFDPKALPPPSKGAIPG